MQQVHFTCAYTEKNPCDCSIREVRPNLMETISHGSACGHPDWPAELASSNIITDQLAVAGGERLEPIPYRFIAGPRLFKERRLNLLEAMCCSYMYQFWYSRQLEVPFQGRERWVGKRPPLTTLSRTEFLYFLALCQSYASLRRMRCQQTKLENNGIQCCGTCLRSSVPATRMTLGRT